MKSALLRLREARDSLSATERSIADYLLSHPEEAMELSIHEMAERTFSSPSTMIRMCHRIGFDGYKEFRRAVTYEMAVRKQSEEAERKEIAHSDSIEDIVEKITYKNIMSLEDTKTCWTRIRSGSVWSYCANAAPCYCSAWAHPSVRLGTPTSSFCGSTSPALSTTTGTPNFSRPAIPQG